MGNRMRSHYRCAALAGFFVTLIHIFPPAAAAPPANWMPQTLSDSEEKKWIDAVKLRKTSDGVSIIQVLQFAEKMRPKIFKIETFEIGYGSDGKPDGVRIGYWIGDKRQPGDEFADLWYDVEQNGSNVTAVPRKNKWTTDTIINALEGGGNSFLLYIDKMYQGTCVDPDTKERIC